MKRRVAALALLLSLSMAAAFLLRDPEDGAAPRRERLRAAAQVPPWMTGAHPDSLPAGLIAARVVRPPAPDREEAVSPLTPPVDPASGPLDVISASSTLPE